MAPGYGQYNYYYDPVGSQANQQQNYAYQNQSAATSALQPTTAAYTTPQYPSYSAAPYGSTQQYGSATGGQQHDTRRNSGATSSATGVRAAGATGHGIQASASRSNTTQLQETGTGCWGNPNYSTSYNTSLQPPSRTQSDTSPQHASAAPASSFGRLSNPAPSQQTQSGSSTYDQQDYGQQSATQNYANSGTSDTSRQTYSATQHQQTATEPSRYASPLHAVQSQQQQQSRASHGKQPSRSSNHQPSPVTNTCAPLQLDDHRQASASAEPVNTTVDPSQVYDFRAEREKKAKAEAERRRKMDEIEASKKAEEERIAEERRKADEAVRQAEEAKRQAEGVSRQAEEMRINEERRRAEQAKRKAEEKTAAVKAAVKAEAERKKEEQRKARESKNAANTLASLATSSNIQESSSALPPANDEEAEMRAMFQKMREFNSKNPSMLAKLWEEERRTHAGQSQSPQPSLAAQPAAPAPKPSAPKKVPSSTPLSASTATPAQLTVSRSVNSSAPTPTTTGATAGSTVQHQAPEANNGQGAALQSNTYLWPPGKKGLLAEIAARWLHSMNTHRVVTTSEILERLDTNPDYVQLCESLEAMGLRFERAAFARELLCGIPLAGPTSQTSPKVTEVAIISANGTVAEAAGIAAPAVNNPKPKRSRATKAEMEQRRSLNLVNGINKQMKGRGTQSSNNGMVDYEMPSFSVPEDASPGEFVHIMPEQMATGSARPFGMSPPQFAINNDNSRQPSLSLQPERRSVSGARQGTPMPVGSAPNAQDVRPLSPARAPADKEEAARKRGFGDLVDLTADDSDDGDLPPMKMMKPSQGLRPAENQQQHAQRLQQPQQPNQQQHQQPTQQADQPIVFRLPSSAVPSPRNVGSTFPTTGIPTNTQLYMQPNRAFGAAPPAVMSAYTAPMPGPATPIAIKPSTVPVPAPQPIKRRGPTNEHLQQERIKGRMVVEPIMRDRVARRSTYDSRTIARDILLATGRHPDMRPLNSHLNAMQKLLGERGGMLDQSGNKSDLATIKWDILDPDPPKKAAPSTKTQSDGKDAVDDSTIKHLTEVVGEDADDEEESRSTSQKPRVAPEGSMRGSAFDLRNVDANTNNKPLKIPKKRGRPPRSSAPTAGAFPSVNSPMNTTSRRLSGPPRQVSSQPQSTPAMAPTGTPVGYAAFRHYDENGKEIKKKGRPVGWRKNVHSREAAGLTPKKSMSAKPKPSAPKPSAPRPESELQEPKYQVYRCHWLHCDAQLHSLEVLKKHVTRVHGQPDSEYEYRCKWRGCRLNTMEATQFEDISAWLAHIDKEHLQAVAWKLGDGPRGGLSGE
jgi:hypothetical protein